MRTVWVSIPSGRFKRRARGGGAIVAGRAPAQDPHPCPSPAPSQPPTPGEGYFWGVFALLPLLPVGRRAMGEEGRGDEGDLGRAPEVRAWGRESSGSPGTPLALSPRLAREALSMATTTEIDTQQA